MHPTRPFESCPNRDGGDRGDSAFILWKEPPGGSGYGGSGYGYGYGYYGSLRWALVRIGNLSDGDQWGSV